MKYRFEAKRMTDRDTITAEYDRREKAAKATMKGQNVSEIIEQLAHDFQTDTAVVTEIVLTETMAGPC